MEIKIKSSFGENTKIDLVEYITNQLDGDDYDRGSLESARATADNAVDLLGKLIDVLAAKTTLTDDDLSELFGENIELVNKFW